jgi:hypothetical protein
MMAAAMIERKLKPDGSVREYTCELVHRSAAMAVVRFRVDDPSQFDTPVTIEAGTISDGWFWRKKPYSLYRFHAPGGGITAHRFDALTDVVLGAEVLSYRDLVLDWWVLPGGRVVEEDREELEDLRQRERLDERSYGLALGAARTVLGRYRHIIDEVEAVERKLGIAPMTSA